MLSRTKLFATGCLLAGSFALSPAMAAAPVGLAGTIGGGYSYSSPDCSHCGHTDNWGFNGQAAFGLGSNDLAAELDAGYTNSSPSGANDSFDTYGVGGNLFWSPDFGRLGGSLAWARTNIPNSLSPFGTGGFNLDTLTYGAFGEYFATDMFTLGGAIGGVNVTSDISGSGNVNAFYLLGGVTGYVLPDIGITGAVQYMDFDHGIGSVTALSIRGEWLVSEMLPISINGGYTRSFAPHGAPDSDIFSVGVKFYFGGEGMTLVGHHRNGALDSLTSVNTTVIQQILTF